MEYMKSVITNIIPFPEITITTFAEHARYPFQANTKVREMESAARDMIAKKEDAKAAIEIAQRKNNAPTEQAKEWLRKVEIVETEAMDIQENNRKRRIFPWSDYITSKKAVKKIREIKSLCNLKDTFQISMHLPPPLAQQMPFSSSISPNLNLALQCINDDAHNIIGIWGMGGVGKTHLLKQINNELARDGAFSVVVFVTCSKQCSEEKVQNKIINKFCLNKNDSMEEKQNIIHNFLNQRSFVLLLDDLWDRVDLDTIGIPNLSGKRKVILTTRSTEVFGQMEVRRKIKVDVLNEDDAWSLFKEKATEETINSNPLIQRCAVEVAKKLGGLPLALTTVGRSMHDRMDPREWEQALLLLKQACLYDVEFSVPNTSVFHILKFSYDKLKNDTLRECFLCCSLWPSNWKIQKMNLVELWMGLGLIDEPEIHTAYNIGYSYIRRLQAVCLLEEVDDYRIRMHDVIRDMALWIACNQGADKYKWIVQAGTYKENQMLKVSHDTEKLSLMYNGTEKLHYNVPYSSTKLSTLLLSGNGLKDAKNLWLESFCELTVLDLSHNNLETFPVVIGRLVHLLSLNLSENDKIKSLPKDLGSLINLKYLLLRNMLCTIPKGVISKLKVLRVLDSSHCNAFQDFRKRGDTSEIFSSLEEELQSLPEFQALGTSISNMNDFKRLSQTSRVPVRWLDIHQLNEENWLSFTSCFLGNPWLQSNLIDLYIKYTSLKYVKFEGASNDKIDCHLGRVERLCFDWMPDMKEVVWKGVNPMDVFPRLQVLSFANCHELKCISWVVCLPCIRELHVSDCPVMKQLICIDELKKYGVMINQPFIPFLKKMSLCNNYNLETILDPMITFPALEYLKVHMCDKLKKLPFKSGKPPKKMSFHGSEEWWNNIEMEDSCDRSLLQPYFRGLYQIYESDEIIND